MSAPRLKLTRAQILAYRRTTQALDERLPPGADSLRRAAWAGLQDSMPRAALLSIHARVEGTSPTTVWDPSLVQLWGPRFSTYVVAASDRGVFTLGRLAGDAEGTRRAEQMAARLEALLDGREMSDSDAGAELGVGPNLRYAVRTGRVLIRWDGARAPIIRMVPAPEIDAAAAQLELARRYLHVFGPATPDAFARWAGVATARGRHAFESLAPTLAAVHTPIGEAWILAADEAALRAQAVTSPGESGGARLLPSGDAYFLLHGADRELLLPEPEQRAALWTTRVWPGAILVSGEIVGTWRRAGALVTARAWRRLSGEERAAVEAEAASLPLPGIQEQAAARWEA